MNEPVWLEINFLFAVHERLLAEFGGGEGIRDIGRIGAAVERPKQAFTYGVTSLFQLAASYTCAIIQGHPFIDGNKRSGFIAAIVFLELNGQSFQASEADAVLRTLALATGVESESKYAEWLEQSSQLANH